MGPKAGLNVSPPRHINMYPGRLTEPPDTPHFIIGNETEVPVSQVRTEVVASSGLRMAQTDRILTGNPLESGTQKAY